MAIPPHLARVLLQHVDPGFGARRLAVLRDIAAHASDDDPGGWIRYGQRELRAAKRSASQAGYDRAVVLPELVERFRILEVFRAGGRGGGYRYRFRDLDADHNWLHVPWLTAKAELFRRWAPATYARSTRVSPGHSPRPTRDRPGRFSASESRDALTSSYATPIRGCSRGARGTSARSVCRDGSDQGERAKGFPQTAHRAGNPGGLHIEKAARSTSGGARVSSSSSQEEEGARAPKADPAALAAVEAAVAERCRRADGRPGVLVGWCREAVAELVAAHPVDVIVGRVHRIADGGTTAAPAVVRVLVDQAAAGWPELPVVGGPAAPVELDRRDYDRIRLDCPACQGSGWVDTADGAVERCEHSEVVAG